MRNPIGLPKTWSGATPASVITLALFATFFAVLFVISVLKHVDHRSVALTGVGTVVMTVFALAQLRMLRQMERDGH
jgi:hypothetical protein